MNELFQNAMWISFQTNAKQKKNKVNPWENFIDHKIRTMELGKGYGIPVFHKRFRLREGMKSCTIHLSSLGCFNLYVNGQKIGTDELMPEWTDYDKRVLYYTYDLTDVVSTENAIAVPVSSGWWAGRIASDTYGENDTAFICVIETEYTDGTKERLCSDLSWRGTTSGPVRSADIWDGEIYDANYDSYETIATPAYPKTKTWKVPYEFQNFKGVLSPKVGPSVRIRDFLDMRPVTAVIYDKINENGTDYGEINTIKRLTAPITDSVLLKKGETIVYDMGQNMVGWEHFTVKGAQNTVVTIRHAEMLNDRGMRSRGNDGPKGSLYTENYRSAKAMGRYTLCGDENGEEYRPAFTFYGFRYVELTADGDLEILSFRCDVVGSDIPETGFIETSNADINRLFSNILWGQRGNYLSVPTDCPQRDERLGWTGDTQIFACTAAYNANVRDFFHKWLQDARDSQRDSGAYTDVIPRSRVAIGEGNAAWSDAGIIVPYVIYKMFGDKEILRECYDSMVSYMDFLSLTNLEGAHPTYGDWLAYETTENRLICIAYYAYDAQLMSKMSTALSEDPEDQYARNAEEYQVLYTKIKSHFQRVYLDESGKLTQTSQTAYLLALKFDLLPEVYREEARAALVEKIKKNGYHLSTGFVGSGILNQTLSEIGESNLAYSLLLQTDHPSWLYSVYQGATTIWERWNSYTKKSGFGDVGMNSFNHYAYGAVAEWMYKHMAGIETDEKKPGFRHIILQPKPDTRTDSELPYGQERITWVRASYESVSGRIESSWYMEDATFTYIAVVPQESYATVYLPVFDQDAKTVTVNGTVYPVDSFPTEKGCILLHLASGRYEIETLV